MYYSRIGHSTKTQNKLQEEVFNILKSFSDKIINEESIRRFKEEIADKIQEAKDKYPRCKSFEASWQKAFMGGGYSLYVPFTSFHIHPATKYV